MKIAGNETPAGLSSDEGTERLNADCRMYGSLLLTFGLCAAYASFADIVILAGNPTVKTGLPLALLVASVLQAFFGISCIAIGFAVSVMDKGSKELASLAFAVIQLGAVPLLVALAMIGKGIVSDPQQNPFIPPEYEPSISDVKFVGSMSFIALVAYIYCGFIGPLGDMTLSMKAIQSGRHRDRSGLYFRGRGKAYNCMLILAGFTQLAIGAFAINKFGNGPLEQPISAFIYPVVFFPEISVSVGIFQMATGAVGISRCFRKLQDRSGSSWWFQALCLLMYLCMMSMQILSQTALAPEGAYAAAAPTMGCIYFGMAFMPAFMDWKMCHVPEDLEGSEEGKVKSEETLSESEGDGYV